MIIERIEAVRLASYMRMFELADKKKADLAEAAMAEAAVTEASESEKNRMVREYLEEDLSSVKNSYLENLLSRVFGIAVKIDGNAPDLLACPCCKYKTLDSREWEICTVCFWEDDGSTDLDGPCGPNHVTLREGQANFEKFGVAEERCREFVYADRMERYEREEAAAEPRF